MSTDVKACIDCVHCSGGDLFIYCRHPDYSYETKDYIHGHVYENFRLCVLTRDDEKLCGDEGRGWEERPAEEPRSHPSIWATLKSMIKELW